jgi:hypothetical protein
MDLLPQDLVKSAIFSLGIEYAMREERSSAAFGGVRGVMNESAISTLMANEFWK